MVDFEVQAVHEIARMCQSIGEAPTPRIWECVTGVTHFAGRLAGGEWTSLEPLRKRYELTLMLRQLDRVADLKGEVASFALQKDRVVHLLQTEAERLRASLLTSSTIVQAERSTP